MTKAQVPAPLSVSASETENIVSPSPVVTPILDGHNVRDASRTLNSAIHAKQRKLGKHASVLKAATDLFYRVTDSDPSTSLQYEELSLRLLPKCTLADRTEIAEKAAQIAHLPHAIAMALAVDDIAVAAPIIAAFEGFSPDDLMIIIATTDKLHDMAIAGRSDLSEKVQEALQRRADAPVDMLTKQSTTNAQTTEKSNDASAPATPAETIVDDPDALVQELLQRETAPHISDLQSGVTPELVEDKPTPHQPVFNSARRTIRTHSISLDQFLDMETAHCLTTLAAYEAYVRANGQSAHAVLTDALNRAEDARLISSMVKEGDHSRIVPHLSERLNLSLEQITRIILDENGLALAVAAKALSLPSETANTLFLLLNEAIGNSVEQIYFLDWFYGQLSPAAARNVVKDWSGVVAKAPRHAPVASPEDDKPIRGADRRVKPSAFAERTARNRARAAGL